MGLPDVSVAICTLEREAELAVCRDSLNDNGLNLQWIINRERGPLAVLRNQCLRSVRARVVVYVDDDCAASPDYLRRLLRTLERPGVVGATGPSRIPASYRHNRDLYRFPLLRRGYDWLFIKPERRPGHLTRAGTFVPDPDWTYEGPVEFLEACHMSFRTEALKTVGGFDEGYGGIGDWSEPDVCARLRQHYGNACLWFDPGCGVEHRCSAGGSTLSRRLDARSRLSNAQLFARRWVRPTWRSHLYQMFLVAYYRGYHGWFLPVNRSVPPMTSSS